ncbi:MAG: wyosine [tRNA(Phe)-imidazoG37] synthetase (radical SAM superfamily) [Planctomycetota bacterium]|jgi:wyosine [tRNA(Phe)-imidazoG37] synthetase (radical SAM superfamily)
MSLTTTDHDRDHFGLKYVYPVVSRRAQGVSVGINLNPNKACNWRCVYCQVPGLTRGAGPAIDLDQLSAELDSLLDALVHGDFLERHAPEGSRVLKDIAFSGDGESTSSPDFLVAMDAVGAAMNKFELIDKIKLVLITNGSLVKKAQIQHGLKSLAKLGGEIWFKLDRGSDAAMRATNDVATSLASHLENLRVATSLAPTWIQTCMYGVEGEAPSAEDVDDYLRVLNGLQADKVPIKGVLLYGMARPPMLPEATNLTQLDSPWMEKLGDRIRGLGLTVRVSP